MCLMQRTEYDALTRLDLSVFVERVVVHLLGPEKFKPNFHIDLLCGEMQAFARGEQTRLIATLPPRNLKSLIISVAYVAWRLGHDPRLKIMCISYGQDLADKHARDCRSVMGSDWYKAVFPATRLDPVRQAVSQFLTTAGGERFSTSIGGAVLGFGADEIIIDDPIKALEVYSDAERNATNRLLRQLVTRLENKATGRIALLMQRLHEDDPVGHLLPVARWKLVNLPAIAQETEIHEVKTAFGFYTAFRKEGEALHPDREPLEVLEMLRQEMVPSEFAGQYLQMPAPPGGSIIKTEWFQRYTLEDKPAKFETCVISWDTALKTTTRSDYSVGTVWGAYKGNYYLLEVMRARLEFPDLRDLVISSARRYRADVVLIEERANGASLVQVLKREGLTNVQAVEPEGDKVRRLSLQSHIFASGRVHVPSSAYWVDEFIRELILFPSAKHDDQVDSASQALKFMETPMAHAGVFEYTRRESKRAIGCSADDERIVTLQAPNTGELHIEGGPRLYSDAQGRYRLAYKYAARMLRTYGWSIVDDDVQ